MDIVVHRIERVAVGRRALGLARADRAGRAADVGDDDRLADVLLQQRRERAEDVVGVAAGRPRHDHLDRPVGVLLGDRGEAKLAMASAATKPRMGRFHTRSP